MKRSGHHLFSFSPKRTELFSFAKTTSRWTTYSENLGSLPDTTHWLIYRSTWQCDYISTLNASSRYWKVDMAEKHHDRIRFHFSSWPFALHLCAVRIENCACDVKSSNGRPFDQKELPICPRWSRQYRQSFGYARRTYQPCPLGIDVTIWRWSYIGRGKWKTFKNRIKYLGHVIWPELLEVSTQTIDAIRDLNTGNPSRNYYHF